MLRKWVRWHSNNDEINFNDKRNEKSSNDENGWIQTNNDEINLKNCDKISSSNDEDGWIQANNDEIILNFNDEINAPNDENGWLQNVRYEKTSSSFQNVQLKGNFD